MGNCLAKLPHSCGSSDGLQVFEQEDGSVDGFCFACKTFVENPYGSPRLAKDIPVKERLSKTKEEIEAEIEEIQTYECCDLIDRKLRKESLEHFGIKIGYSQKDGVTPTLHYYPYHKDDVLVGYKVRLVENKRMWSVGDVRNVDLFGWNQAIKSGSKRLIITEGELDAVAIHRILQLHTKDDYKEFTPAVVSIPHGAGSAARDISRVLPKIRKHFKQVSLCFDNDDAGQRAIEDVCKILPEATVITLPCKDANDCIINNLTKPAFNNITFNASPQKNSRLVWGYEVHEQAKQKPEWGLSWPWEGLTEFTRGLRFGETIYIAAGEKMGKSELVNAIGEHLITKHGLKIMMAKPEEANVKTYKLLNSKVTGNIFHDPKVAFNEKAFEEGGELIKNNVCMLNLYQHISWDNLKSDIYSAVSQGVKAVFIDPITNLTNGMQSGEADGFLKGLAQELAAMAKDLDIVIFIFCHLNKPAKGATPWDRGGVITTDYFAGSSAMARSCNYAIGLEGNKDPSLSLEERNMRQLVLLADREFGETGKVNLYWDYKTGLFNEVK